MALEGVCEVDELYVHAGMKGRGYHEEILESGRMPSRRGLKHGRGRGGFTKDFPMVMCYHQRGGSTVYGVPQEFRSILGLVMNVIAKGSRVYTDEFNAYDSLAAMGYRHESVCHKDREYARGDVHVNNCECRAGPPAVLAGKAQGSEQVPSAALRHDVPVPPQPQGSG